MALPNKDLLHPPAVALAGNRDVGDQMPQSNEERAEYQRQYRQTPEGKAAREAARKRWRAKVRSAAAMERQRRDYYAEHPPFGEYAITKDEYDAMIARKEADNLLFGPAAYGHGNGFGA